MAEDFADKTYTVSFKSHAGYDASLIVVRGETVEELDENVKALHDSFLETVAETEGLIRAVRLANEPDPAPPAQPQSSGDGNTAAAQAKFCDHGKRTRRTGNGARGAWVGYFCPLRKGDPNQCKPIFEDA